MTTEVSREKMAAEFESAIGRPVPQLPTLAAMADPHLRIAHAEVLLEETLELIEAMGCRVHAPSTGILTSGRPIAITVDPGADGSSLVEIAKECTDVTYVNETIGAMYGLPMSQLFAEVHRSNMTRIDENGKVRRHPARTPNDWYRKPQIQQVLDAEC